VDRTRERTRFNRRDALLLWHSVTLETILRPIPDLTTRQLAVLTTVYLIERKHTVRSLAKHLNVTKAVITRALDTLGNYGYLTRGPDPDDRRSVIIHRTSGGTRFLQTLGDLICADLKDATALAAA